MSSVRRLSVVARLLVTATLATVALGAVDGWRSQVGPETELQLADVGVAAAAVAPVETDAAPVAETAPSTTVAPTTTVAPPAAVVTTVPPAAAAPPTTAPPAPAVTAAPVVTAAPTIEQRGAAALALVPFPVERTGYRMVFEGHRDGYLGLTSTVQKTITIYIRSSQSTRDIAKVIAHEVGHAVDVEFTTETERSLYRQIRGIDSRSWYPSCSGCTDYDSPAGDFAETFAVAMVGDLNFLSRVAPAPTAAQLGALASIFTI